jgi:hypothetical protein
MSIKYVLISIFFSSEDSTALLALKESPQMLQSLVSDQIPFKAVSLLALVTLLFRLLDRMRPLLVLVENRTFFKCPITFLAVVHNIANMLKEASQ